MADLLSLTGDVVGLGDSDVEDFHSFAPDTPHVMLQLADGRSLMVLGITRDEARKLGVGFSEPLTLSLSTAALDHFIDDVEAYLEAQDALDNREYMGINAEPYEVLMRRVKEARRDLDTALSMKGENKDAKDAARYRWLRQRHWDDSNMCVVVDPKIALRLGSYCPSGNLLDDRIDSAMKGEQPS